MSLFEEVYDALQTFNLRDLRLTLMKVDPVSLIDVPSALPVQQVAVSFSASWLLGSGHRGGVWSTTHIAVKWLFLPVNYVLGQLEFVKLLQGLVLAEGQHKFRTGHKYRALLQVLWHNILIPLEGLQLLQSLLGDLSKWTFVDCARSSILSPWLVLGACKEHICLFLEWPGYIFVGVDAFRRYQTRFALASLFWMRSAVISA